jgi:hypothetical protein
MPVSFVFHKLYQFVSCLASIDKVSHGCLCGSLGCMCSQFAQSNILMFMYIVNIQQMYIRKLMEIFRICEERGNTEGLRMMFKVVKGLSKSKLAHFSKILKKID